MLFRSVPDGDKPLRRLDTQTVNQIKGLLADMSLDNINETRAGIMALLEGGEKSGKAN